ncbi:MAG: sigma-70 family RNA polymerase sigma factor [Planctomycetota bacterium]
MHDSLQALLGIKMTAIHDHNPLIHGHSEVVQRPGGRRTMTQPPAMSLLQQVAAGQSQAVAEVIDAYGGLVWSLARKYFGRTAEAEDAVQDAFIAVWKSAERFDPEVAGESTYIAMIARRRMIDQLRKQGRRPSTQALEGSPEPEVESNDRLADEEQVRAVLSVIDELDPPQPEVIKHSLMDGLTHPEIAERTGLPLGTVKTHIRRGLIKVRQALGIRPQEEGASS